MHAACALGAVMAASTILLMMFVTVAAVTALISLVWSRIRRPRAAFESQSSHAGDKRVREALAALSAARGKEPAAPVGVPAEDPEAERERLLAACRAECDRAYDTDLARCKVQYGDANGEISSAEGEACLKAAKERRDRCYEECHKVVDTKLRIGAHK